MASVFAQMLGEMGKHAIHTALEYAVRFPWQHPIKEVESVLGVFIDAVGEQQYDRALLQCTPGLSTALRQKDAAQPLGLLRSCFVAVQDASRKEPEVHPVQGTCRISGTLQYTTGRSGTFRFDLKRTENGWKLNDYEVRPIPTFPSPPSLRSVNHDGVPPLENGESPAGYPIKGSRTGIFHTPESRFYEITRPALCFANEEDAKKAGYRACR